ncbi:MAG: hypothetical protein KDH94_01190 [Coxiellaceae bacterium]|nr:hypothetical protein [Coxiellaceae bacterium]
MRRSIFKKLPVLMELSKLDDFNRKNLEKSYLPKIASGEPSELNYVITHLTTKIFYQDIFQVTEHSEIVRNFCRRPEYENVWKKFLSNLKNTTPDFVVIPGTTTSTFDQCIGFILAREFNKRVTPQHSSLQSHDLVMLYNEIKIRGVIDGPEYIRDLVSAAMKERQHLEPTTPPATTMIC